MVNNEASIVRQGVKGLREVRRGWVVANDEYLVKVQSLQLSFRI